MTEPSREIWVHPRVAVHTSAIAGRGLLATQPLEPDTVVVRLGGRLVDSAELARLIAAADAGGGYVDSIAVDLDIHLVLPQGSIAHFGNHSCDPSLWLVGAYELATRRPVDAGEELTLDYGTISDSTEFDMACACGATACRTTITGVDWRRPELQRRYAGHWPPGLQRRIAAAT